MIKNFSDNLILELYNCLKFCLLVGGRTQLAQSNVPTLFNIGLQFNFFQEFLFKSTNGYLHKQSLCHSINSLFSNPSRKYCCDANIFATKCVHFESFHFD